MRELLQLLKAGDTYGIGALGLLALFLFWLVARLASAAGRKAVSYVGDILRQSEELRVALREELRAARAYIQQLEVKINALELENRMLRRKIDDQ